MAKTIKELKNLIEEHRNSISSLLVQISDMELKDKNYEQYVGKYYKQLGLEDEDERLVYVTEVGNSYTYLDAESVSSQNNCCWYDAIDVFDPTGNYREISKEVFDEAKVIVLEACSRITNELKNI